jgi:predicted RNA-binding Zn ribbon-like protein
MAETPEFAWIGGDPSLDFNNTVSWDSEGLTQERLRSPADLARWAAAAGLSAASGSRRSPGALADALALRGALHRLLLPISLGRSPAAADRAPFDRFLRRALPRIGISPAARRFRWSFAGAGDLHPALAEVVWSAARLLTSPDLARLRTCADPECGWLFLDRSRRGNRRWCEMRECGNRAKARRYYRRHLGKVRSAR